MSEFRTRIIAFLAPLLRTSIGKKLVVWSIVHLHTLIPMKTLYETNELLAFFHPQPTYPFHVIMVPKTRIPDLPSMDMTANSALIEGVFSTAQKIVEDYHLEEAGYRLIVNGGKNQDFPILHFHLVSDQTQPGKEAKYE